MESHYLAINLKQESFAKNKKFTKLLFEADIPGKKTWFDTLDCSKSLRREYDSTMTLDTYLKNISMDVHITYFINRETFWDETMSWNKVMSLVLSGEFKNNPGPKHFAWFKCLTQDGYDIADKLFQSVYKKSINDSVYRVG